MRNTWQLTLLSLLWSGSVMALAPIIDARTGALRFLPAQNEIAAPVAGQRAASHFLDLHRKALGIGRIDRELQAQAPVRLADSWRYDFIQVAGEYPVIGARVAVNLAPDGQSLLSISSTFVPKIRLQTATAKLSAEQAIASAKRVLPGAEVVEKPQLWVVPSRDRNGVDRLAWLVHLTEEALAVDRTYAIDATDGFIDDSIQRNHGARDRITIDFATSKMRREGSKPLGIKELDAAHDFTGAVYDYFKANHGFDSFDGRGKTIVSHLNRKRATPNAWYEGARKTLNYTAGFAVDDVVAHEYTHGVIAHTAGLVYREQSGALNESYADVFGVMNDLDDWEIGEDLPASFLKGRPALRSVGNPKAMRQPDHVRDYKLYCGTGNGVHHNSGIPNMGFYQLSLKIGRAKAARIYFKALTSLSSQSDFDQARVATLQAAQALFPGDAALLGHVRTALASIGWVEGMQVPTCPVTQSQSSCPIAQVSAGLAGAQRQAQSGQVAAAYRLRDEVFAQLPVIGPYARAKYGDFSGDIARTLIREPAGSLQLLRYMATAMPLINRVGDRELKHIVDAGLANETQALADLLIQLLRKHGKNDAAEGIAGQISKFVPAEFVGMTYEASLERIRELILDTQGEGDGENESESESESEAEAEAESESEAESETQAESDAAAESESETEANAESDPADPVEAEESEEDAQARAEAAKAVAAARAQERAQSESSAEQPAEQRPEESEAPPPPANTTEPPPAEDGTPPAEGVPPASDLAPASRRRTPQRRGQGEIEGDLSAPKTRPNCC